MVIVQKAYNEINKSGVIPPDIDNTFRLWCVQKQQCHHLILYSNAVSKSNHVSRQFKKSIPHWIYSMIMMGDVIQCQISIVVVIDNYFTGAVYPKVKHIPENFMFDVFH